MAAAESSLPSTDSPSDKTIMREITPQQAKFRSRVGKALETGNLTIIIGAGVSISAITTSHRGDDVSRARATESMSWYGLLRHGLAYIDEEHIPLTNTEKADLQECLQKLNSQSPKTPTNDEVLHIASFLKRILTDSQTLHQWFDLEFEGIYEENIQQDQNPILDAIRALYQGGARIITTNYDDLLDKHIKENPILADGTPALKLFFQKRMNGICHVHGVWWHTKGAILDNMDYNKILQDDTVQQSLKNSITSSEVLLFVGAGGGLHDPNFGNLLAWAAQWNEGVAQSHCVLACNHEKVDTLAKGLNVLRYGHEYSDLPAYLMELAETHKHKLSKPIWHVPFDHMTGFVGRTDELRRLKQKIFEAKRFSIMSLLGLGGVGKSRLALELACQIKSEHPQHSIFWIQAAEQLTFEKDMLEIGKKLRIPGIEDDKADVKTLVKQRLSDLSGHKWFLVLDNADNEELWRKPSDPSQQGCSLVDLLPRKTGCSILVTTRSRLIALFLAGKAIIELPVMPPSEAAEMFMDGLVDPDVAADRTTVLTLMEKLTYLPLAIVQAASFINRTQEPVQQYLKLLDQTEEHVIELLSKDFEEPSGHQQTQNPVATTWLISFEQIRKHHQLATRYLASMACIHEKNIPLSLLPEASPNDVVNAVAVLVGYSFVRKQTDSNSNNKYESLYDMHRLVHLVTRNWLRMEGSYTKHMIACVRRVAQLFPTRDHEHKDTWTIYLPHGQFLCADGCIEERSDAAHVRRTP